MFFFSHLQQYKNIIFKTVGNSATQTLNKETSPSLSTEQRERSAGFVIIGTL